MPKPKGEGYDKGGASASKDSKGGKDSMRPPFRKAPRGSARKMSRGSTRK